ncbi:MAG: PDZ domain-containing protein [Methylophilaceae bacterium]
MFKKLLALVLVVFFTQVIHAAENLYEKHYKEQNDRGLKSLKVDPDTKLYVSNHSDVDNISMLESGYDMMGSTGFEAGSITPDMALQHAKSIEADVVLVYSKYAAKESPLSKLEAIKEAAKTTGEVDPELLEEAEEQYKYYASYWAKMPMPLLGLHVIKLKRKSNEDESAIAEEGLKVLAVIKDSPAFEAGLLRGDVLLRLGNVNLQRPEALSTAVRKYQGKKVEIAYERNHVSASTLATINTIK